MTTTDTDIASIQHEQAASPQLARLLDTFIQRLPINISVWHLEDPDDPTANGCLGGFHARQAAR
jgi:hypothetical protein